MDNNSDSERVFPIKSDMLPLILTIGLTVTATTIAFSIQPLAGMVKMLPDNELCICPTQINTVGLILSVGLLAGIIYIINKLMRKVTDQKTYI